MKKCVGSLLALYPMPLTVIGAMSGSSPTWTLVAHVGIIGHDLVMVSLSNAHFINGIIKKTKKLTINLVSEEMLPQADLAGSISGAKADKSQLFSYKLEDVVAPIIDSSPLVMACTVRDVYETLGFESFICTIDRTYVEHSFLNENGKPDYH